MAKSQYSMSRPRHKFTEPEGKSKGILDDYGERQVIDTKEGTIQDTPTLDKHIPNKKYVDDEILNQIENGTAAGQMAFWNGTKWVKTETSELFWDDTNKRLGVNKNNPAEKLGIVGNVRLSGIASPLYLMLSSTAGAQEWGFYGAGGGWHVRNITNSVNPFSIMNDAPTNCMRIIASGNVGINKTIPAFKLDVNGTFRAGAGTTYTAVASDGELYFVGTGGLPYGSCSMYHGAWSQVAVQNTWYNVSDTDFIDGLLNSATHDGNGKLTVARAGIYKVDVSLDIEVSAANKHTEIGFEVSGSGSAQTEGIVCKENVGAGNEFNMSTTALLDLAANATIELCVRTTDAGTPTITVDCVNLNCVHIGGT